MTSTGVLPSICPGNRVECGPIFWHGLLSLADPLTID